MSLKQLLRKSIQSNSFNHNPTDMQNDSIFDSLKYNPFSEKTNSSKRQQKQMKQTKAYKAKVKRKSSAIRKSRKQNRK